MQAALKGLVMSCCLESSFRPPVSYWKQTVQHFFSSIIVFYVESLTFSNKKLYNETLILEHNAFFLMKFLLAGFLGLLLLSQMW